jgi:hypothetical protein
MYCDGRETNFSTTWGVGTDNMFAFLFNKEGNFQNCWHNGKYLTPSAGTGAWGANVLGTNAYIGSRFNATQSLGGTVYLAYLFNRVLTPTEIKSLYTSPYQFISRPSQRFYSIAEEPPASTLKLRTLMGVGL